MDIGMISLGCAKNQVAAEQMLFRLREAGHNIVIDETQADAIIVNTCGFIEDAKQEAVNTIIEMAALKIHGKLQKLIVTGCLVQVYRDEILKELPEVDAVLGVADYDDIAAVVATCFEGEVPCIISRNDGHICETPRVISTGSVWAYLLISEGCDNGCSYCLIPKIRGPFRSRPMESILAEAKVLAERGYKELILVAQDLTKYGVDLYDKPFLASLLRELVKIEGIKWIRLHYLYPYLMTDELIEVIATEDKIVKYLDIPVQHVNDTILKKMNRRDTKKSICELFDKLYERIPNLVLRTSLITGLPYENEEEFEELCEFLLQYKLPRAGVFAFSPQEGTAAYTMPYVDNEVALMRADQVRNLQATIMDAWEESLIDTEIDVLCEYFDEELNSFVGRAYFDSPDIDGRVIFRGDCEVGDIVKVAVDIASDGELIGFIV